MSEAEGSSGEEGSLCIDTGRKSNTTSGSSEKPKWRGSRGKGRGRGRGRGAHACMRPPGVCPGKCICGVAAFCLVSTRWAPR